MSAISRIAGLHVALWSFDPWYRAAWCMWPASVALLVCGWIYAGPLGSAQSGNIAKPGKTAQETSERRAILFEEDKADPSGRLYVGRVRWFSDTGADSSGSTMARSIRAEVEVPDRKFRMTMSVRRNTDPSLFATIDLAFAVASDVSGGGIAYIPGVLMREDADADGTFLIGTSFKRDDNDVLISLSNLAGEKARNLVLLRQNPWIAIPIKYNNQHRVVLILEKGEAGAQAFSVTLDAWRQ